MEKPMIRKIALGIAAAIAMTISASGAANAQVCSRVAVSGAGKTSLTAVGARFSARNVWRANVRRRLGSHYASVSRARVTRDTCWKVGKRTACRFVARPCRA
jgi:hypothetical protein